MQLHPDEGATLGAQLDMGPGKLSGSSNIYNMQLEVKDYDRGINATIWNDGSPTTPLALDVWYDFILHVTFSPNQSTGVVELWMGRNGGPKVPQTLNCAPYDQLSPTSCGANLLTPGNGTSILKLGHYRHCAIADTTRMYHSGMVVGEQYTDVDPL